MEAESLILNPHLPLTAYAWERRLRVFLKTLFFRAVLGLQHS